VKKCKVSLARCILISLVLVAFLAVTACASSAPAPTPAPKTTAPAPSAPAAATKITIKAVTFQPKNSTVLKAFGSYINLVNEKSKGDITINWAGGGDVIPPFDQGTAVRDGVVDMAVLPTSYFSQLNAAIMATAILSQSTPTDEYNNGILDFMNSEAAKVNLHLIGRYESNMTFHIGVKKPVEHYKELAGRKMRDAVLFNSFTTALGCASITLAPTEVYNALDRGVIDAYNFPYADVADFSLFEVCKYFIDHTVYEAGNLVAIINDKTFNSYPKDKQDILMNTLRDYWPALYPELGIRQDAAKKKMLDNGMKAIKFSDAEAKEYRDLAYSSFAAGVQKQISADTYSQVLKLVTPKK
jgi:TRAP-type transport system periplasmic protein